MIQVVHLTRMPGEGHFSIEGTFAAMREVLGADIQADVATCPHPSRGIWPRLKNIWAAQQSGGDIQHILGDVHYLAFGTRKSTTILTICDCGFAYHESPLKRFVLRLIWLQLPARRVARICAISEKTKAEILSLIEIDPALIDVIPVCIADAFKVSPKAFVEDRPVILQVGTGPNKNVPRLIAALDGLPCELHIVGRRTPEIDSALKQHVVACHFSERLDQSELVAAYRQSDIVSFVSTYEGFGMPIVEAQTVGRVVVTSDLEPMRGVAGGAAALADPFSVSSIREQLLRLIHDGAHRDWLVEQGLENAKKYRSGVVAAMYRQVYERVWKESGVR